MTKIPLKAVTVTYTKTITVAPTSEMFEDWECPPDQEAFESLVLGQLFDEIHYQMGGPVSPMPYTDVQQFEEYEIEWESEDDD